MYTHVKLDVFYDHAKKKKMQKNICEVRCMILYSYVVGELWFNCWVYCINLYYDFNAR